MLKRIIILLCITILAYACSKTVKGPRGNEVNVNIGGWGDMKEYKEAREEAKTPDEEVDPLVTPRDCNVVDCPGSVREGRGQY